MNDSSNEQGGNVEQLHDNMTSEEMRAYIERMRVEEPDDSTPDNPTLDGW